MSSIPMLIALLVLLLLQLATALAVLQVIIAGARLRKLFLSERLDHAKHRVREAVEFATFQKKPRDKMLDYVRSQISLSEREFLIEQLSEDGYQDYIRRAEQATHELTNG